MATRAQKVKVGVFVTVSTALLAGSLILVSGFTKENVVRYCCEFPHTVGGLAPGAAVRYSGVPVGKVKSVWVAPNQTVCVNMEVFKERITLYEGVRAGLDLAGIMGGPVIELAAPTRIEEAYRNTISMGIAGKVPTRTRRFGGAGLPFCGFGADSLKASMIRLSAMPCCVTSLSAFSRNVRPPGTTATS